MYLSKLNLAIVTAFSLLLAACAAPPKHNLPELTFKHLAPISLQVAEIEMLSQTNQMTEPPYVGYRFPVSPKEAITKWAEDRLQLAGNRGTARFTIIEANVTETKLKIDKAFTGLFKQEASERYDAIVEARLEILDDRGSPRAVARSRASWTKNVREDTALTDRRRIWFVLIENLMASFNARMEEAIRRYMSEFLY